VETSTITAGARVIPTRLERQNPRSAFSPTMQPATFLAVSSFPGGDARRIAGGAGEAARCFFFSSRRRHTRSDRDWTSDVCSSDLHQVAVGGIAEVVVPREVEDLDDRLDLTLPSEIERLRQPQIPREVGVVLAQRVARQDEIGRASCRERV